MTAGVIIVIIVILAAIVIGFSYWIYRLSHPDPTLLRRCPYCNAIVHQRDNFCPNCGKPLHEVITPTEE